MQNLNEFTRRKQARDKDLKQELKGLRKKVQPVQKAIKETLVDLQITHKRLISQTVDNGMKAIVNCEQDDKEDSKIFVQKRHYKSPSNQDTMDLSFRSTPN